MYKIISALIVLLLSITSCSDQSAGIEECSITVDAVSIIDSIELDDDAFYLVHRVSGWSDKTEVFELYDEKPEFDHCSKSSIDPLFGNSLEMSKTLSHVYLDADKRSLDFVYVDGEPPGLHNSELKLEIK